MMKRKTALLGMAALLTGLSGDAAYPTVSSREHDPTQKQAQRQEGLREQLVLLGRTIADIKRKNTLLAEKKEHLYQKATSQCTYGSSFSYPAFAVLRDTEQMDHALHYALENAQFTFAAEIEIRQGRKRDTTLNKLKKEEKMLFTSARDIRRSAR